MQRDKTLKDSEGYCDASVGNLVIRDREDYGMYYDDDQIDEAMRGTLRHEIIHAFFHECGMMGQFRDEAIVEWIATQLPKLIKACVEAGALVGALDGCSRGGTGQ
jgi:hypothetical protein